MGKAKLSIVGMDDDVLRKFKQLVIVKHGTLRRHIGDELMKAMQMWMEKEEGKGGEIWELASQ